MDLNEIRQQIDSVDRELVTLFEKRMNIVKDVALYKQERKMAILQPEREKIVIDKARQLMKTEALKDKVGFFFETLMDISKNSQYPYIETLPEIRDIITRGNREEVNKTTKIVCQGTQGSYSHICATQTYPEQEVLFTNEFRDVFEALKQGKGDIGVLPIENSTAGSVAEIYDLLNEYGFFIIGSEKIKVEHCLLAKEGTQKQDITKVISHWQALKQCKGYLERHPQIKVMEFENTALAAKEVSKTRNKGTACISSKICAELYNLQVIEEHIEDFAANYTRFIFISKQPIVKYSHNRLALLLKVSNAPGSLYKLLTKFAIEEMNLTKIESRPLPNTDFEVLFYLEVGAKLLDPKVEKLISAIKEEVPYLQILGSFLEE